MGQVEDWKRLLDVQRLIQEHFPECVLVGGTAVALHVQHRYSKDVDSVLTDLRGRFPEILKKLETIAGWKTKRREFPNTILGNFEGVRVGIRQLRRSQPLEVEEIDGIRVPTLPEMLRVKGYLIATRNTTRDFVDFAALANGVGQGFEEAMASLDALYPQEENTEETMSRQLYLMLAEPKPYDLAEHQQHVRQYRHLQPPWDDFAYVEQYCRGLAVRLMSGRMGWKPRREGP